jgi:NAD(P) transhydrogenase
MSDDLLPHPDHFDLVVIGGGPAGEKGAAQAAYFGKRVCIIDKAPRPGGAAVNTGTIPSKTLRETALYFSGLRQRGLYGVDYTVKNDITISDFMYRERAVVEAEWERINQNLDRHGIQKVQGMARFIGPNAVEVSSYRQPPRRITGEIFLVVTGSAPLRPELFPFDDQVVVDSDSVLRLEKIPTRMIVVGGGVIGTEYACIFAALGCKVTLVNARARLLQQLDPDASEALETAMTRRLGISVVDNTDVERVTVHEQVADVLLTNGTALQADCVLVTIGRRGNTEELDLPSAGVTVNTRGYIDTDPFYRTSTSNIYAAGDVIGFPALASVSMEQARVAICHAFDLQYKREVSRFVPYCVWTIPEVAMVGETEDSLRGDGTDFEIGKASFKVNARGEIIGEMEGFIKLLFDPGTQHILGATVVGEGASELIHVVSCAMHFGATLDLFIQSVFNYPTLGESFKYAAYDGLQRLQKRVTAMPGLRMSAALRPTPSMGVRADS